MINEKTKYIVPMSLWFVENNQRLMAYDRDDRDRRVLLYSFLNLPKLKN